jgi:hypothetical protein
MIIIDNKSLFDVVIIEEPLSCVNHYLNTLCENVTRRKHIRLGKISKNRSAPLKKDIGSENSLIKYTINSNVNLALGAG